MRHTAKQRFLAGGALALLTACSSHGGILPLPFAGSGQVAKVQKPVSPLPSDAATTSPGEATSGVSTPTGISIPVPGTSATSIPAPLSTVAPGTIPTWAPPAQTPTPVVGSPPVATPVPIPVTTPMPIPAATPTPLPVLTPIPIIVPTPIPLRIPAGESAYPNGTPWPIPGKIAFDNYDSGGSGLAYNTLSATNIGGEYRNDGVGIEICEDSSYANGYDVGWNASGNWYKYLVNVQNTAAYNIAFRVAGWAGGGSFHIEDESGSRITGTLYVPTTGGWQNWTTIYGSASLSAGNHILRVVIDNGVQDYGVFNLNSMSFSL